MNVLSTEAGGFRGFVPSITPALQAPGIRVLQLAEEEDENGRLAHAVQVPAEVPAEGLDLKRSTEYASTAIVARGPVLHVAMHRPCILDEEFSDDSAPSTFTVLADLPSPEDMNFHMSRWLGISSIFSARMASSKSLLGNRSLSMIFTRQVCRYFPSSQPRGSLRVTSRVQQDACTIWLTE